MRLSTVVEIMRFLVIIILVIDDCTQKGN